MKKILILMFVFVAAGAGATGYGDIVISEIMVDPEPCVKLPDAEYIEIFNRTANEICLMGWQLHCGDKSYSFPICKISAGQYLLLCSAKDSELFLPDVSLAALKTFPELPNSGKLIYITASDGSLVTCLNYSDSWYKKSFKAKGGWSLECIDTDNISGESCNWMASESQSGGTPGERNSVTAINPDTGNPFCMRLYVPSSDKIELCFNKSMDPVWLNNSGSYGFSEVSNIVTKAIPDYPEYKNVTLVLSDTLAARFVNHISLQGMRDVSGNTSPDTSLLLALPEEPDSFCLSLNEVMFNPSSGGYDYVEFVNRSDRCIDLSKVWISDIDDDGYPGEGYLLSEKPLPCLPGSYWLLSENTDSVCLKSHYGIAPNRLDVSKMPPLPDDAGNVALLTTSAAIIDRMFYRKSMHFALISESDGVSIEKINPDLPSDNAGSWASASSTSGYGTPGFKNSQYRENNNSKGEFLSCDQNWFSPDNDGVNDFVVIKMNNRNPGMITIKIFNLQGRVIRTLLENRFIGSSDSVVWDGTSDSGSLVEYGRYILYAEFFTPEGLCKRMRIVLSVLL